MKEEFYTDGNALFCFYTANKFDYHGLDTIIGHKTFHIQSLDMEVKRLRREYRRAVDNGRLPASNIITARGVKVLEKISKLKDVFYDDFQIYADGKIAKSEMAYMWQSHCNDDVKLLNVRFATYDFRRDIAYLLQFSDYNPSLNFTRVEIENEKVTPWENIYRYIRITGKLNRGRPQFLCGKIGDIGLKRGKRGKGFRFGTVVITINLRFIPLPIAD
jgi:hypothetical protein